MLYKVVSEPVDEILCDHLKVVKASEQYFTVVPFLSFHLVSFFQNKILMLFRRVVNLSVGDQEPNCVVLTSFFFKFSLVLVEIHAAVVLCIFR